MIYPIYRIAKVLDINDPEKKGKVKVRILPELNGVMEDSLPWIGPETKSNTGSSLGIGTHNVPDLDSHIEVKIVNKYWTEIYYTYSSPVSDESLYDSVINEIDIEELNPPTYPQPSFKRTKDGTIFFHDTDTGDVGIQHPSGLYVLISSDGSLYVRSLGDISFKGGTFQIGEGSDSVVLFTPLEEILIALLEHKHTAPSGPTTAAEKSNKSPLSSLKSKLKNIQSIITTSD